jgi:quercetin dioxygenase-like cupin family protein
MEVKAWNDIPWEKVTPEISRKIITGGNEMLAQVFLEKDAVVAEHSHSSEQITYILDGALKLFVEGKEFVLLKGQVLVIPPNVPHKAVALEKTLDLDIFSPIRQDWLDHTDSYFQNGR